MLFGKGLTRENVGEIKAIDGVENAEGKVTFMGTIAGNEDRTLELNFIETNEISKLYIVEGEEFNENKKGVWINEYFAKNNNLKVGDTLNIKYDSAILEEKILGIINVPDHVYSVKDSSEVFPNHNDYGFCYLSINEFPKDYIIDKLMLAMNINDKSMIPDFNIKDTLKFTSIMVNLEENAKINDIKKEIENKLENVIAVIEIEDTLSYNTYQTEIEEGKTYAGVFTVLFLLIAVLSVITTMTRVVKKQRTQIGTLKALRI